MDVDLAEAVAAKLGVKIEWQETAFEQMLPALQTGRVDAIMSGMRIAPTGMRRRASSTTASGPQFFALASRAADFKDMQSLCGKSVGASRRTVVPVDEIEKWSAAHCAAVPIKVVGTEGSGDARTQLRQGRIDAAVQGSETLPYVMGQEPNTYVVVGEPIGGSQLTGMAVGKDDAKLQPPSPTRSTR